MRRSPAERALLVVAVVVVPSVLGVGRAGAEVVYERTIEVGAPGPTFVDADAGMLLHAGDAAFELFDPEGRRVRARLTELAERLHCEPAALEIAELGSDRDVLEVRPLAPVSSYSELRLDQEGAGAGLQTELQARTVSGRFQLVRPVAYETVYRPTTSQDAGPVLFEFALVVADSFRFSWPASSRFGLPRNVALCKTTREGGVESPIGVDLPSGVASPIVRVHATGSFGGARRYRIEGGPTVPVEAVEIELPSLAWLPKSYRVQAARDGRWETIAEGPWPGEALRRRVKVLDTLLVDGIVRIELDGSGAEFIEVGWSLVPRRLHFEAPQPGAYRLVYPVVPSIEGEDDVSGSVPEQRAELGPEQSNSVPGRLPAGGTPAPIAEWSFRIPVPRPEGVGPGSFVAVDLPAASGRWLGERGQGARVLAGGVEVPFVVETAPEPESRVLLDRAQPRHESRSTSRLEFDLGERDGSESAAWGWALELRAPAEPESFRRTVRLVASDTGESLGQPRSWSCLAPRSTPCVLEYSIDPGVEAGRPAALLFEGGDPESLQEVSVELAQPRQRLEFLWPESDAVEIVAGGSEIAASAFDSSWQRTVVQMGMTPRRIELEESTGTTSSSRTRSAWGAPAERALLLGALVLVGLALAALAVRLLLRREGESRG